MAPGPRRSGEGHGPLPATAPVLAPAGQTQRGDDGGGGGQRRARSGRRSGSEVAVGVEQELTRRARTAGLLVGLGAVLVMPAWIGFDVLLEPERAWLFAQVRLLGEAPMLLALALLWRTGLGVRWPSLLSCVLLAVIQGEVAWMTVRTLHAPDAYLLGMSLAIYASGCLLGGRARWTGALVAVTWVALGGAVLLSPRPVSTAELGIGLFYMATASLIGLLAHYHRYRLTVRELRSRDGLEREQDRTRELLRRLERLSHEDPLTGLANRRRWESELDAACAAARSGGQLVAVVLIDVDRFKLINDRYGHAGGDRALLAVAELLRARTRSTDLVARLGGDELGVLMTGADLREAVQLAEQLRQGARHLDVHQGQTSVESGTEAGATLTLVTLSLGVAAVSGQQALPMVLMAQADEQLYRAKSTRDAVSPRPEAVHDAACPVGGQDARARAECPRRISDGG